MAEFYYAMLREADCEDTGLKYLSWQHYPFVKRPKWCCEGLQTAVEELLIHFDGWDPGPRYYLASNNTGKVTVTHCPFCGKRIQWKFDRMVAAEPRTDTYTYIVFKDPKSSEVLYDHIKRSKD